MQEIVQNTSANVPQNVYKPSELIGIFNSILAKQSVNAQVVYLRGVYLASGRQPYSGYFYDTLRDEDGQEELTLRLTQQQRNNLKNGNLVNVGGVLNRSVSNKGFIQLNLNVSRIDIVQEQAIDENEIKRMELRRLKVSKGYKTVDTILEGMLFVDQRPLVALVLAQSSITMTDFNAGINAAKTAIDFRENRVNFANTVELCNTLKSLDTQGFTVIAMVRGGGTGIEKVDELDVLNTIVNMNTPTIAAIGHPEEKLFIKQIADKEAPTPNGLGQYFSEMVENVSEKKTKSRAALTEQIKKQFKDQLEAGQKQNKELQEKLKVLTKNQEEATKAQQEATKKHNEQVAAAQKQNKDLQEQLKTIQKTHEQQIAKLNETQKQQLEQQKKQQEDLTKNLTKMQESNTNLQKDLVKITNENTASLKQVAQSKEQVKELEKKIAELQAGGSKPTIWIIATVVLLIALLILIFTR